MTEQEWRAAKFAILLELLNRRLIGRKGSCFSVAHCRMCWNWLTPEELSLVEEAASMEVAILDMPDFGARLPQMLDGYLNADGLRQQLAEDLLRDIFGNPFRPVVFAPAWRTEHTTGLALKMYDERVFAAMPILADALEEAGCDSQDILTHCREPGVHVRGCWVVDLVLGKE